jgi:hypothetical protein
LSIRFLQTFLTFESILSIVEKNFVMIWIYQIILGQFIHRPYSPDTCSKSIFSIWRQPFRAMKTCTILLDVVKYFILFCDYMRKVSDEVDSCCSFLAINNNIRNASVNTQIWGAALFILRDFSLKECAVCLIASRQLL